MEHFGPKVPIDRSQRAELRHFAVVFRHLARARVQLRHQYPDAGIPYLHAAGL